MKSNYPISGDCTGVALIVGFNSGLAVGILILIVKSEDEGVKMITLTPSTAVANTYSLNWNYQQNHVLEGLKSLIGQDDVLLTDVTLACDGEYIHAHKLVLSLCSSFFKDLFMVSLDTSRKLRTYFLGCVQFCTVIVFF